MTKLDYYLHDCFLQGWKNVWWAVIAWKDLLTSNYENYDCFLDYSQEQKEEAITLDFWDALEDDILPYQLLVDLREIVKGIDDGTVRTFSWEEYKEYIETLDVMFDDD